VGKRVESTGAVIRKFLRKEEAHTRREGMEGNHGLASKYVASTNQWHLVKNGVVVAIGQPSWIVDGTISEQHNVLVYPGTSVVGDLVKELKRQGYTKAVKSPMIDVWIEGDHE